MVSQKHHSILISLFISSCVVVGVLTVVCLNWIFRWSYQEGGFMSYVLAGLFSLLLGVFGCIGEHQLDWRTKLFLMRWLVMLITGIYLIFWLVNECLIAPAMSV